ncbi:probable chitinase 2 [Vespa crabro]|uniref:probable chitinase 2 n=1 Tax=Vespa crabro TaxID=7445 RepID=UPI001EFFBAEA|nr:probable chitinase 2 [Vespa crabro]
MNPMRNLTSYLLMLLFLYINSIQSNTTPTHGKVVACYVATWAKYRPSYGKFTLDNLKPQYCTHLIYAFAGLNTTTWEIQSLDRWNDIEEDGIGNYRKMTALRNQYPRLKVSIAIGGWNEGSGNYSILASDKEKRKNFVDSVFKFLREYKFDGIDLDWEFPSQGDGKPEDKQNFLLLVKDLKQGLPDFIVTSAISPNKKIIDEGYDIPEISKYLDYIHIMAYDYHGSWDTEIFPNAPLYSQDNASVDFTVSYLLKLGAPPGKLILGLPMYGRTYISTDNFTSGEIPIGTRFESEGFKGPYTGVNGTMGYNEICTELKNTNWMSGWDLYSKTLYAVNKNRVIMYDNHRSLREKVLYANKMNLGGVMVWSIDTDDFHGNCGIEYILMKSINRAFKNETKEEDENKGNGTSRIFSLYNILTVFCAIVSIFTLTNL